MQRKQIAAVSGGFCHSAVLVSFHCGFTQSDLVDCGGLFLGCAEMSHHRGVEPLRLATTLLYPLLLRYCSAVRAVSSSHELVLL